MKIALKIWKLFLSLVSIILIIHFVKDITQDLFGIRTYLDNFGNIVENTSKLPEWLLYIYHWGWINAIIFQLVIPYLHFKNLNRELFRKVDQYILSMIVWISIMLFWAINLT